MSSSSGKQSTGSNLAEDLYVADYPPDTRTSDSKSAGLTQRVETRRAIGQRPPAYDKRKFRHDKLAGMSSKPISWHVSKDDRMEANEAGDWLERVHSAYGLVKANPDELEAFDKSLFFCHTVNSGSVLQPGRSKLYVRGEVFSFDEVVRLLGVNIRRFFRAFADEVREVNKEVLKGYTQYDPESREKYEWLIEVATDRGLSRYPELAHDTADKCSGLTVAERMALASSKISVFTSIINSADRINSNARVIGADPFDSTNLKTVHPVAVSE